MCVRNHADDDRRGKKRQPVMIVHFQPVLVGQMYTHSLDSRFLISVLPAEQYAEGTLDCLFTEVTRQCEDLFSEGHSCKKPVAAGLQSKV